MGNLARKKGSLLHRQFADLLRKEIGQGKYKPGDYIPSERELVEQYGISRTTVRRALSELIAEGLLKSVPGSGTAVAEPIPEKRRKARSRHIGWVLNLDHSPFESPYYSEVFRGMETAAKTAKYHCSLFSLAYEDQSQVVRALRERDVEGAVFVGPLDPNLVLDATRSRIAAVAIDNPFVRKKVTSIIPDNRVGALEATEYLLGLGHKKIAFLGAKENDPVAAERIAGYEDALDKAGIRQKKVIPVGQAFSVEEGRQAAEKLLKGKSLPTAILAINDEVALGAMQAVREAGRLEVPGDLSIVGFDDIAWAERAAPPLTTVRIEKEETGAMATRLLVDQIEGRSKVPAAVVTPVELIVRSSCATPRSR